ncbi:TraR/DksA C4-type zinc finger protein [Streptomyces sp. NPDC050439]|uniref:TraR/DksA C4-type zinc finger protein n=1 Tax=unclassified Streptomyces TaxID=2593676 RepID=UPI00342FC81E
MGPEDQSRFSRLLKDRRLVLLRFTGAEAAAAEVKAIERALHRLAAANYGWCELCGAEIGHVRLEQQLTATACADCQKLGSSEEGQAGDASDKA